MSTDVHGRQLVTPRPKALIFDLMGTCLDWHKAILPALQHALPSSHEGDASKLALHWRQAFFDRIHARSEAGYPQEDIDETHRRTLSILLHERGLHIENAQLETCVRAWHAQKGRRCCPTVHDCNLGLEGGLTTLILITSMAGCDRSSVIAEIGL